MLVDFHSQISRQKVHGAFSGGSVSIQVITGNLFNSKAQALVNTVNCVGVMGKGIALEFRRRFPDMFEQYQAACSNGKYLPGEIYFIEDREKLIINCAIKDHWRNPSKIEWLDSCLTKFVNAYSKFEITSVAFPWMGAQNGNLPLHQIQETMHNYLDDLPTIQIEIYNFDPASSDPLFEKLKEIAQSPNPEAIQSHSGLRKDIYDKVIRAIQTKRITSLYMLSEKKIVGEKTIDKIYKFLNDFDFDTIPHQLGF